MMMLYTRSRSSTFARSDRAVPIISETRDYNGFAEKVRRLRLSGLVKEATSTLTGFTLRIEEQPLANGTQGLRKTIDAGFAAFGGWVKKPVGGIDWTKRNTRDASLGVEVQVSGRSDMLAVDILHLSAELLAGRIDVGLIIVPDDHLSRFLTDRTPNFRTAIKHIEARASDLPFRVLAFRHDGTGPALEKMRTNVGRSPT
jgi:hypothetical protein